MVDLEKVKKGVRQCAIQTPEACNDCPYDNPEKSARCGRELMKDVLEILDSEYAEKRAFEKTMLETVEAVFRAETKKLVKEETHKVIQEAYENGITNYVDWIEWKSGGKEIISNAEQERIRASLDMAQEQDG